jgi:trehalose synthase
MIGLKGAELVLGASVQFVMAVSAPKNIENSTLGLHRIEDYSPLVGVEKVERILKKAGRLRSARVGHVNSTLYGGGVAEILTPLTLLMNTMGVETDWRVIQGTPEFFSCTKKIHNGLQGPNSNLYEAFPVK